MDKDKQRVEIAKACGWTECQYPATYRLKGKTYPHAMFSCNAEPWKWMHRPGKPDFSPSEPPDYLNALNAMHAALATLDDWDHGAFFDTHLCVIIRRRKGNEGITTFDKIRAEAHELAESFLLTKNLWTPTGEENEH